MKIVCTAVAEDERQRENLCQCIGILGGVPCISGDTVSVEFDGPNSTGEKFIELFEHFSTHTITTLDTP